MNVEMLTGFFGWCAIINLALLTWWFLFLLFAHDWTWRLHSRWFQITRDRFDAIHYSGMAFYKISIFMFNVVPWLALNIIT